MMNVLHKAVQIGDNHRWIPLQNMLSGEDEIIQPGHDEVPGKQTGMIEPCFKPRAGEVTSVNQKNFEHNRFAVG